MVGRDFNADALEPKFKLDVSSLDAQLVRCRPRVHVHDVPVAVCMDASMIPSFLVAKGHGVGTGDRVVIDLVSNALRHVAIVEIVHLVIDGEHHLQMNMVAYHRSMC